MTTAERLLAGRRVSWPVDVETSHGRTIARHDTSTLCAVALDDTGAIVIARDQFGYKLGACGLAVAVRAILNDWPVVVDQSR